LPWNSPLRRPFPLRQQHHSPFPHFLCSPPRSGALSQGTLFFSPALPLARCADLTSSELRRVTSHSGFVQGWKCLFSALLSEPGPFFLPKDSFPLGPSTKRRDKPTLPETIFVSLLRETSWTENPITTSIGTPDERSIAYPRVTDCYFYIFPYPFRTPLFFYRCTGEGDFRTFLSFFPA